MSKELNDYEMMLALKPLLPDDLRKKLHKEFVAFVQESGGEVLDADVWGKRYLAYPIKGHNEGYYIIYDFKIGPEYIAEIKRTMQLKQEVLKFMVIKLENAGKVRKSIKKKEIEI
ncbi:TPA: 30S ribosomal protein S6 [Candidatus Dojkabacteria bacterium]|uniref:Small ribosomal subunit protein bS6 n=1 Tax=Candidatus Dojkabacteria bacterium TaxID=2099670 RepID=A0A832QFS4_9BACT|nr:30S ribosomal protein S6 [Candidatus Dojkabacteria bacterium]